MRLAVIPGEVVNTARGDLATDTGVGGDGAADCPALVNDQRYQASSDFVGNVGTSRF